MKSLISQLPTILGTFAAMLVAFLSLLSGTSPSNCVVRSAAAFLVFSGFGLVLRYALLETSTAHLSVEAESETEPRLDVIVPGTSVADLLGVRSETSTEETQPNH